MTNGKRSGYRVAAAMGEHVKRQDIRAATQGIGHLPEAIRGGVENDA